MTAPILRIMFVGSVRLDTERTYASCNDFVFTERENGDITIAPKPGHAAWFDSVDGTPTRFTLDVKPSGVRWVARMMEAPKAASPTPITPKRNVKPEPAPGGDAA